MKRYAIAIAAMAALGMTCGRAFADPGGFAPPGPQAAASSGMMIGGPGTLIGAGENPAGQAPDCYGWTPSVKRFFHKFKRGCGPTHGGLGGKHGGHGGMGGMGGGPDWAAMGYGLGGPAYNPNGPMMQGTLVFPHHPFVRSPRDFFMYDLNK
jgi:hypothetical protein